MKISPNEELTEKVVAALGEAGLIAEKHRAELTEKMQDGTAKDTDWRLWIETTLPKLVESEEENHHG